MKHIKITAFLLTISILLTSCTDRNTTQSSSSNNISSDVTSDTVENIDTLNDVTLDTLLNIIQRYEFIGNGNTYKNVYDADLDQLIFYGIFAAIDQDKENKFYNSTDFTYTVPVEYVREFLEISFRLYNFAPQGEYYNADKNAYVMPDGGKGYIVDHKIRTAQYLPDGTIEVIVDGYYPQESTPNATPKKYIFKEYTITKLSEFWSSNYTLGEKIFQIKSVNTFYEGKLKKNAIQFDNPTNIMLYTTIGNTNELLLVPVPYYMDGGFETWEIKNALIGEYNNHNFFANIIVTGEQATVFMSCYDKSYTDMAYTTALAIGETLYQNISTLKQVELFVNEEPVLNNEIYNKYMSDKNVYIKDSVPTPDKSMAELKVIADTIPNKISSKEVKRTFPPEEYYFKNKDDKTAVILTDYLSDVFKMEYHIPTFDTPSDMPPSMILAAGLSYAPMLYWDGYASDATLPFNFKELSPFSQTCTDFQGQLKTHVEMAAKELLGDNIILDPYAPLSSKWKYDPYSEIYTPPHMSIGYKLPVVLKYKEDSTKYTATVVFLSLGYGVFGDDGEILKEGTEWDFANSKDNKMEVVINKTTDNKLNLYSLKPLLV